MSDSVFIGVGSNLNHPVQQVLDAIELISGLSELNIKNESSLYQTEPMGPQDQPSYINAAIEVNTSLKPIELLHTLQTIETQQGRTREGEKWGARTLDLDILLFAEHVSKDPLLTLPHPGLSLRSFVLYPLYEIDKQLNIPGLGPIKQLIEQLGEPCPAMISSKNLEKRSPVC